MMPTRFEIEGEDIASVDYFRWFFRVLGWDAILPFFVSMGSIAITNAFNHKPPADILALVGLPIVGFVIRLMAGTRHIKSNACGNILRGFQRCALILALVSLVVVDFFVALSALVPKGNLRDDGITAVCFVAFSAYLVLAIFAMYPGRLTRSRFEENAPVA